jgi:hypothetical protein
MRAQFLAGARVVLDAVGDDEVAARWNEQSVLEGQSVAALAGHLARGSVWVVEDYLSGESPVGARDFETAADYFATVIDRLTADDHLRIRDRGAAVAEVGHQAVVDHLAGAVDRLSSRLPAEPPDRLVAVYDGLVMALDDYLWTRIVEQVVHLDDLARSLGRAPWPNPPDADSLVLACAVEVGRRRFGGPAMIRALFRSGVEGEAALPVL